MVWYVENQISTASTVILTSYLVFSRCADTLEDGKRLENLSWRLWGRESYLCSATDTTRSTSRWRLGRQMTMRKSPLAVPELSSSVESAASSTTGANKERALGISQLIPARPEIRRAEFEDTHSKGKEKHITPDDLKDLVVSIRETQTLDSKLPPLPPTLQIAAAHTNATPAAHNRYAPADTTPRPSSPPRPSMIPESSTSTVATQSSDYSEGMSPPPDSEASTSTELSTHSIVRGFSLGQISSSIRSSSHLAPPTPILKNSPTPILPTASRPEPAAKSRKKATFTLGGSSGEGDDSSFETRYGKSSSLAASVKKQSTGLKKNTSFKEEVDMRTIKDRGFESEEVFESDSEEEDEDHSESAIEEDDDIWEDEDEASGPSSINDRVSFKRVDSKPNLTSRRSLLTQAMHEPDRARALQNAASKSSPAIRRSRTSTPNGPSLAASPRQETEFQMPGATNEVTSAARSKPILMTTSNSAMHLPPMSPRTTRRNMLQTEMTESLRKHLLWERQQKNSTHNAHLKRRHTSMDVKNLQHYPRENLPNLSDRLPPIQDGKATSSWTNNHFDNGLLEYHEKGW